MRNDSRIVIRGSRWRGVLRLKRHARAVRPRDRTCRRSANAAWPRSCRSGSPRLPGRSPVRIRAASSGGRATHSRTVVVRVQQNQDRATRTSTQSSELDGTLQFSLAPQQPLLLETQRLIHLERYLQARCQPSPHDRHRFNLSVAFDQACQPHNHRSASPANRLSWRIARSWADSSGRNCSRRSSSPGV